MCRTTHQGWNPLTRRQLQVNLASFYTLTAGVNGSAIWQDFRPERTAACMRPWYDLSAAVIASGAA